MNNLKRFFPFYKTYPNAVYLDNAASTQKEESVLEEVRNIYTNCSFPVGRSHYSFAEHATALWTEKKEFVANFFNIPSENFAVTSSATTASNAIASNLAPHAQSTSIVIIPTDAHHSLSTPWLKKYKGTVLWIKPTSDWNFDYQTCEELIKKHKNQEIYLLLSARSHIHGYTINFDKINSITKNKNIITIVDATQLAPHAKCDLAHPAISASFFSGHKIYAPYGTGCTYVSDNIKEKIKATIYGGGNVENITEKSFTEKCFPHSLEVGSPNLPSICALAASCKFISKHGIQQKSYKEHLQKISSVLRTKNNVKIVSSDDAETILTFYHTSIHAHDIARTLSEHNIYVRSGFMCSDTAHTNIPATVRISFACYNDSIDTEKIIDVLNKIL